MYGGPMCESHAQNGKIVIFRNFQQILVVIDHAHDPFRDRSQTSPRNTWELWSFSRDPSHDPYRDLSWDPRSITFVIDQEMRDPSQDGSRFFQKVQHWHFVEKPV